MHLAKKLYCNVPRGKLAHGAAGSVVLRLACALLSLFASVILGRSLGPSGYGTYAFSLAIVNVLAIPLQAGLPTLVIREVASYQHRGQWSHIRGLLRWSNRLTLMVTALFVSGAYVIAMLIESSSSSIHIATFMWALALLPMITLRALRQATLRGFRYVVIGQIPELLIVPVVFVALLIWLSINFTLTPAFAMSTYFGAAAVGYVVGAVLLSRLLPIPVREASLLFERSRWRRDLVPLSLISGLTLLREHADIFLLGLIVDDHQVGLYRVALAASGLVVFTLSAMNVVVAPHIAKMYAAGEMRRLQRTLTISARLVWLTGVPVAGMLIYMGPELLLYAYGSAYVTAWLPMVILAVGQLTNVFAGSVVYILCMTGHERDAVRGIAASTGANILLALLFIPTLGINGAAIATMLSLLAANLYLWYCVRARLGINSIALRL